MTACSGYSAVRVPLGPVDGALESAAPSCGHLVSLRAGRGFVPNCENPRGFPADAAALAAEIAERGRRERAARRAVR